ncbi:MFS transporter [Shimwellia blattae]|uniref:Inner membrane metabolite transport protein YgcS n=1 Tax=Shimwellia blattae (strain ATCC 29907 / DSM 4481 / JCM 1650 / NBRC 105725 / CDC 9005-74) TaxID=630626 RepID=I2BCW6_SHIBC|nr:MFS transporter [Shimwellia blattae]AFJ48370.1 inner membrane metabolite transport protein YgcS [Shimwellia blattae DSM 4481 = NBRC 105725]GAB81064.1 putative major facilitator superfamily transporter YaaU [Shimwellia blattae DSM 4481 = NBRC 105725]VDY65864.1 Inner membrane metabolite transport protein ygcS [Shimwellia blattae]VEC26070.1 Inner membrane metabolite transport protein ygcS [Shimwellia blattae]
MQSRNFDDIRFSAIHRRIMLWGSGGPFLDGYVLVIIGVALEQLTPLLALDARWIGLLGAATLAGLFIGTSLFGYICDRVGRRKMFLIDIIAIGVISLGTMFVSSPMELLVMRFLVGVVIGADYPIATSMITEFSSTRQRAFAVGFIALMWYVGATCANLVGFALYDVPGGWRWMLGSAVIPCLVILVGRFDLPESPRWLIRQGRREECDQMMIRLFGEKVHFEEEPPQDTHFSALFNRRHLPWVLFTGAIWTCQVVPMFAIYTYGPHIVGLLGLDRGPMATLGNVVISLFFMLGCLPAMYWLNRVGRRSLLLLSFLLMTLALGALGLGLSPGIWLVVSCFAVYAFFSGGPGILQWLYPNELFPTAIRASAVGLIMSVSRIGTVISTWALPVFISEYGIGPTMLVGAGISLAGLVISLLFAPETRGMPLGKTARMRIRRQWP